jgi:long-chain acyl-CoA synthetase
MNDASRLKRWMFDRFIEIARKHGEAILERRPVPLSGRLAYALGEFFVYGPLKNVLGLSNIRVAYTAGEAIGPTSFPSSGLWASDGFVKTGDAGFFDATGT